MKNFLKLVTVIGMLLVSTSAQAETASTNLATASIWNLRNNPIHLLSLEVVNNGASTVTVNFYDTSTTNLTYVVGAYTNSLTYTTNIVVITSDYYGNYTTNTNAANWTYSTTIAQSTNNYRLIKSMTAGAGLTTTWTPAAGVYNSFGLAAQNNVTNTTINYQYSNLR